MISDEKYVHVLYYEKCDTSEFDLMSLQNSVQLFSQTYQIRSFIYLKPSTSTIEMFCACTIL